MSAAVLQGVPTEPPDDTEDWDESKVESFQTLCDAVAEAIGSNENVCFPAMR